MDNTNEHHYENHNLASDFARFIGRALECVCLYHPEYAEYLNNLAILSPEDRLLYWSFFPFEGEKILEVCPCCRAIMEYEKLFGDQAAGQNQTGTRLRRGSSGTFKDADYDRTTAEITVGTRLANGLLVIGLDKTQDYKLVDPKYQSGHFSTWKVLTVREESDDQAYSFWLVTAQDDGWCISLLNKCHGLRFALDWLEDENRY